MSPWLALLWLGCQGCTTFETKQAPTGAPGQDSGAGLAGKSIRIVRVENRTPDQKYDSLALYVQLKAAEMLENSGRYQVVNEEAMRMAAAKLGLKGLQTEAVDSELKVEILTVKEGTGGSFSAGLISVQGRSARVRVAATVKDLTSNAVQALSGEAKTSKGAWGVIAKVDREAMLKGQGFWELDKDMLGIAAAGALKQALAGLLAPPGAAESPASKARP